MGDSTCVICEHRDAEVGHACSRCLDRIGADLRRLVSKIRALEVELVPGAGAAGPKVATTRVHSPSPVRDEALNLTGPGRAGVVAAMHPHVRRWRTVEEVTVTAPGRPDRTVQVNVWHQELVRDSDGRPVMLPDDDQLGIIPPVEWMHLWVRSWAAALGHREPTRLNPLPWQDDAGSQRSRQERINLVLGLTPGNGGRRRPGSRTEDPLADEWEVRWGSEPRDAAPALWAKYLQDHLAEAAHRNLDLARFAADLRTVSAELGRVLGEQPDKEWLGRCPATIAGLDGAPDRPCGAGLWTDPYIGAYSGSGEWLGGQVMCTRCRTTWGPKRMDLLRLAEEIRRVWPIDRRRRYNADEIATLNLPLLRCPACRGPVDVTWREVSAPGDERRTWRPERTTCPAGCPDAERIM